MMIGTNQRGNKRDKRVARLTGSAVLALIGIVAALVVLQLKPVLVKAQSQTPAPPATPTPTPTPSPRPVLPEDELAGKMRAVRNDPPKYLDLLIQSIVQFPDSRYAESGGYSFASALKKQAQLDKDPAKLRALAERYINGTLAAPAPLRVRMNGTALRAMLDNDLPDEAASLARQTIALLNEKEYLVFMRSRHERDVASALKANPKYKPMEFVDSDWSERFVQESSVYYTHLGNAELKLNKLDEADAAFRKAYELARDSAAAAGLATVLEKRGKDSEALEYLTEAVLSGKLNRAGLDQFYAIYRRTHGGNLSGVEEHLDNRYRRGYRNPVKGEKYTATSLRTGHAVLAEFFTGAGCIPCIPFDYTFESTINDYSRRDVVLLVFHFHAPTLDPMGNRSTDGRLIYYGVNSAPTLILDGEKFKPEEAGDTRLKSVAVKNSQTIYGAVKRAVDKGIETPLEARIKVSAERSGRMIRASASVDGLKNSVDATLNFALVEDEVHYSGENGLRLHPMVVRNLAKPAGWGYGFSVEAGQAKTVDHSFDLDAIIDENRRYYDEWPVERNKEVNARVGGEMEFDVGRFKQERHLINPEKISVVAFLQDNKTKKILQSAFVRVVMSKKQPTTAGT
ncbi:MAG: hypothetical protein ABI882_09580, partial [Acidobacteriota bacterium]